MMLQKLVVGLTSLLSLCALPSIANAQSTTSQTPGGSAINRTWRVGAKIQTSNVPISNMVVTFPVPTDWPEQQVNVYEENIPKEATKADFRDSDGIRQMYAKFPRIDKGTAVEINVILDIRVFAIPYPDRTDHLVIPDRPPREVRLSLSPSPLIESRKRNIKNKAKELVEETDVPWERARKFYDFVTSEIAMEDNKVIGAEKTLKEKKGSPEDRSNLFIALCRANKIPARMVWADEAEYAEFYLQDESGNGRWYPAVLAGKKEFGQMTDPRVIIQKGDNIKIPEKSQRQRFVVEFVTGNVRGGRQPRVRFLRDVLPARDR
ncbi:MAG: transglutaminase domain-containing protein [Planctomycetaceae bacterium]|nr:transglutaminase domain-containing protein [Planctomycetaceae bacterium]